MITPRELGYTHVVWLGRALSLPDFLAFAIDDAYMGHYLRNVESDELFHKTSLVDCE
jgi:hypothetical protein